MIDNKHIGKIILSITALALAALLVFMLVFGQTTQASASGISMAYENFLFSTDSIIDVDVSISESDWEDLLENAISEEYYSCDVTVNGTEYKNVGFRAKGNTSLSMVASSDSDRYSFKISFDEYVDGQNCDGLSKLVLNNNYSDATMMKEAICYDMFAFLGADASLYNYAKVSINGEYYGVYLALEPVEESFAMRNYGTNYGELYKPDSMELGGPGKMKDWDGEMPDFTGEKPDSTSDADSATEKPSGNPPQMPSGEDMPSPPDRPSDSDSEKNDKADGDMGGKGFSMGSGSGASLNYIDDSLDSYEAIWEGSVFNTTDKDHRRVVKALKNICADGTDSETLAEYMDVDNVLRYMAVQTFVVNLDSLSGNMAHNYYLYESDSKLNIIPWDYNLAFGGFQSQDASDVINFPIDTPFSSGVSTEDRQFFMSLLENEEYLEQYHEYLRQLTDEYVGGGIFENTVSRITSQIDDLVESDPTSFYSYTEYKSAVEMLKETVSLRAESIRGQLDGTIPSTRSGQEEDASALIDSSSIDLNVMGVMNAGGGGGKDGGRDFGGSFAFGGERNSDGENDNRPAPNGAGQVYKNKFLAYYTYFKFPSR
ncbi:MAG: CotH kinase family protein [Firmicutes bacterium]|nr:CotH kinase family protein [Bacillota bacterium]